MADSNNTPREWIIPCNTGYYDIYGALTDLKILDWRQTFQMNNAKAGDLVYIYVKPAKGTGSIAFKGAILKANKPENTIDDSRYSDGLDENTHHKFFEVAVFREFDLQNELTYSDLSKAGLKSRLQGPTVVSGTVADYLHRCDAMQIASDRFSGDIPDTCLYPFPIQVNEILSTEPLDNTHSEEEKTQHARTLTKRQLRDIAVSQGASKPKVIETPTKTFSRNPYIAEYTKKRANGRCQLCGNEAPFKEADGTPYLESHHIVWLSEGGADSIYNTVALCPNCHRKMHHVKDPKDVEKLQAIANSD